MNELLIENVKDQILEWLKEDDVHKNHFYLQKLPHHLVQISLKIKSDVILSGLQYFIATFNSFGIKTNLFENILKYEGQKINQGEVIVLEHGLPFNVVLTAERLALNLLQHSSSISTWTYRYVEKAKSKGITILDTRKTTPGLRSLEKYAVRVGGGENHRFGQTDLWMIKDNHKACLGGLKGAFEFFKSQGVFYQPIMAEIHSIDELKEAKSLGINHLMLDNFSKDQLLEALKIKTTQMTYEVSGGVRLSNLDEFLIEGVDAISIGALTNAAPRVDLSLKYRPI